jgi:hypothetical protein
MNTPSIPETEREYLSVSEGRDARRRVRPDDPPRIAMGELRGVKLGTAQNSVVRVSRDALAEWLANSEGPAAA